MPQQAKSRYDLRRALAPLGFALGLALVAVSWLLPLVVDGSALWSPEQAAQYQSASRTLHQLSHEHVHRQESGTRSIDFERELAEAKADYQQLRAGLDRARSRPQQAAWIMRAAGFALAAASGMVVLARRESS